MQVLYETGLTGKVSEYFDKQKVFIETDEDIQQEISDIITTEDATIAEKKEKVKNLITRIVEEDDISFVPSVVGFASEECTLTEIHETFIEYLTNKIIYNSIKHSTDE